MPDPRVPRADLVRRAQPFVGERRRHPDVDDRHVGLVLVDRAQQLVGATPPAPPPRSPARRRSVAMPSRMSRLSSAITTRTAAPR